MRRGCISLGNIYCDLCHRSIPYPERYLFIEELRGQSQTLCLDCCLKRGFVKSRPARENTESLFNLSSD